MGGRVAPEGWRGGLKNVAYNLGPELIGDYKLRLVTHNYIKRQRSFNVISTVKGSVEPTQRKYDVFFPYYHTGYETFYMLDKIVDPGFRITQGCSRIVGLALRYFADSHLLPFHLPQLPVTMKESLEGVKKDYHETLLSIYPKFSLLEEAVDDLTDAAQLFDATLKERVKDMDPVTLRAVNDQVMKIEQLFLLPAGLPGRPESRHAVFAPSQFNNYAAAGFPGLLDLLYKIDTLQGQERADREEAIKKHISQLTILMHAAAKFLKDLHLI